jgi:hypothetical protein
MKAWLARFLGNEMWYVKIEVVSMTRMRTAPQPRYDYITAQSVGEGEDGKKMRGGIIVEN